MGAGVNILIGARTHQGIGGSQTWCATVAAELSSRGHQVQLAGAIDGDGYESPIDLAIVSHAQLWGPGWNCTTINVSHGIIGMERPGKGFDHYVFVSEEARDHWNHRFHDPDAKAISDALNPVIRQPIDCEFWQPNGRQRESLLYRHSYYPGLHWLPGLASEMGFEFAQGKSRPKLDARASLLTASLAFSSGRGALESMACGTPTIICDMRAYADEQPLMHRPTLGLEPMPLTSYSGRGGEAATKDLVRDEVARCLDAEIDWRAWVVERHEASMIVDQLLEVAGG